MKYLENSFKFLGKYFLFIIPLFIAIVIPALINAPAMNAFMSQLTEISNMIQADPTLAEDMGAFMSLYSTLLPMTSSMSLGNLLSIVLTIIFIPPTYGFVSKALDNGNAGFGDFVGSFNNIGKYLLFLLFTIILYFGVGIGITILFFLSIALMAVSVPLGTIFMILLIFAAILGIYALTRFLLFWFPAMVSDNLGVFEALKKSFSVAKSCFWPVVGISLLVFIGTTIVSAILGGIFGRIPGVGTIITSLVSALSQFIMIVFAFEVYRDKSGKNEYVNDDLISDTPGEYL